MNETDALSGCAWEGFFSATQTARWLSAIASRFSCRKYSGPADTEQLSALHYMAGRLGLPGIRIVIMPCDSSRVFFPLPFVDRIEYAMHLAAIIVDRREPRALWHAGIAGEALCLEATALGLGSCWVSGSYRRKALGLALRPQEKLVAVIPFGQMNRPEGAVGSKRKALRELCLDDPAGWPFWAYEAAESVRLAPSAVNLQPWRFAFAGSTLMLSGRRFGSLDYGIAALHLLCGLRGQKVRWRFAADQKSLLIKLEESHDAV